MLVIDADAHVEESEACWSYLEPEFQPRRPLAVTLPRDTDYGVWNAVWLIDNKVRHYAASPTTMENARLKGVDIPKQELADVAGRLDDMDRMGVATQVIYPSTWLGCLAEEVTLEAALARSYNTYMATQCAKGGGRLKYCAVIPWRHPLAAVQEIRRICLLGNVVSVMARGMEWDLPLDHPMFEPIYDELARQGLTLALHVGFGSPTIRAMFDGIPRMPHDGTRPRATVGSRLSGGFLCQYGFERLMRSGIPDRFPRLRLIVLEIGSDWLPNTFRSFGDKPRATMQRMLAERRLYVTCEADEDIPYMTSRFGDDFLVMGSDYPHDDGSREDSMAGALRERGDLSEATITKILQDNPARCYNLF